MSVSLSQSKTHPLWAEHVPFPPYLPLLGFKGESGGWDWRRLAVELTSGLGVMDVSIKDTETRSVTDISIPETLGSTASAGDRDVAKE